MARTGAKRPPNLEMWGDIAFPKAEIKVRALGLLGHYDHRTAALLRWFGRIENMPLHPCDHSVHDLLVITLQH